MFEAVTGRTLIDSCWADRASTWAGIECYFGPPPSSWIEHTDEETRRKVAQTRMKPFSLDRYLRIAYDQDYAQFYDLDEDELEGESGEHERPIQEFTGGDLDALSRTLRKVLCYDPMSRGTPETLLCSPWFKGQLEGDTRQRVSGRIYLML